MRITKSIFLLSVVSLHLFFHICTIKSDALNQENKVSVNVKDTDIDSAQAHCALGYAYLEQDNAASARSEFEKALNFDRNSAAAYNGLGMSFSGKETSTQYAIENFQKVIRLNPDYIEARYNLGKVYYEYEEKKLARRSLKHIIDLDTVYQDTYYLLGKIDKEEAIFYRSIVSKNKAKQAIHWFNKQIEIDLNHWESFLECGELYYLMEECSETMAILQRLKAIDETNSWADFILGWCYYHQREYERAFRYFERAILLLEAEERTFYAEPLILLTDEETEEYESLSEEIKKHFWSQYWNMRDPTPTTETNERIVEHYFRTSYSRWYFSEGQYPWDTRGEIYIRYGEPDFRTPNIKIYPVNDQQRLETLSKVSPALSGTGAPIHARGNVRVEFPTEKWIYFDLIKHPGTQFVFADRTFTGKYEIPAGTGEYQPAIQAERAIEEKPEIYQHDYQAKPLDFPVDMADFRSASITSALEIYYGIPLGEVRSLQEDGLNQPRIEISMTIFNRHWERLVHNRDEFAFTEQVSDNMKSSLAVGSCRMELLPETYYLAIQAKDHESKRIGIYKTEITLNDYTGSNLMISDLQLAVSITPATRKGKLVKNGLKVIPHPVKQYQQSQPVYLYFEMYNLTRDDYGKTHFRTDYTLSSIDTKRDVITKIVAEMGEIVGMQSKEGEITISYEGRGTDETEIGYTSIDMRDSPPGEYQLTVLVEDLNSEQKVRKSVVFTTTN